PFDGIFRLVELVPEEHTQLLQHRGKYAGPAATAPGSDDRGVERSLFHARAAGGSPGRVPWIAEILHQRARDFPDLFLVLHGQVAAPALRGVVVDRARAHREAWSHAAHHFFMP